MSYAIEKSKVPLETLKTIDEKLTFVKTGNDKFRPWGFKEEPIKFFDVEDDKIHIPYLFSSAVFDIIPNEKINYPDVDIEFTGTLLERQKPVVEKAFDQIEKYGTTTLGLYPGFGKTTTACYIASKLKKMTVILVHREILATQWKKTLEERTKSKVWIVGDLQPDEFDVIICMDTRFNKIGKDIRDKIGTMIIDEAHAFCVPSKISCLLYFHPIYIIALSATLIRSDGMEVMIYAICGNHGIHREFDTPFDVIKLNTHVVPERKFLRNKRIDYHHLKSTTLFNDRRNQIICDIVKNKPDSKILILTSLCDHAIALFNLISQQNIECDYFFGKKKSYVDSSVLIGTISKIGTGFDPATSCPTYDGRHFDMLILASSIKETSTLVQNVGRVFRCSYPTVIHLVDKDNIYNSHWNIARRWYVLHGGKISHQHFRPENESNAPTESKNVSNWHLKKLAQLKKSSLKK